MSKSQLLFVSTVIVISIMIGTTATMADISFDSELETQHDTYRWMGHDFVFCFITDDAKLSNLVWADVAREMGFRYTIAVNSAYPGGLA